MNAAPLAVIGPVSAPVVTLSPEAMEARRAALALATEIGLVESAADLEAAAKALASVKGLAKAVEDSRKDAKAPVLEAGRAIDVAAKEFLAPLDTEGRRLSLLVGAYQDAERRKAERARREAEEAERAALAEMDARERERVRQESAGRTGTLLEDVEAIRDEAAKKIADARAEAAIVAANSKADGVATRTTWRFEVTDIEALYRAHPELVVLEPNGNAIRAIIKHKRDIPGLRVWAESAAVVRAAKAGGLPANPEAYDY
jgi:hypothetical protein